MKKRYFCLMSVIVGLVLGGCAHTDEDMKLTGQGLHEISKGNYDEAGLYLERALTLNPENPYALLNMGVVYQSTGKNDKAREMYSKVFDLYPNEKVETSNKSWAIGKSLAEVAGANLALLDSQESKVVMATEAPVMELSPALSDETTMASERQRVASVRSVDSGDQAGVGKEGMGYYRVRGGESLYAIAGREDVYNDHLKWLSLLRLNVDKLGKMKVAKDFYNRELSEGLELRYLSPEQARQNLTELGEKVWAANVLSLQYPRSVVPSAVWVTKRGYCAYTTEANIQGKAWMRLRVGFFQSYSEALREGRAIMCMMNLPGDPWIVKLDKQELVRFGGY